MSESKLVRACLAAAPVLGARLFRNNVGKLQDRRGTWVAYGLYPGSPDLVGWMPVVVTPDMVGRTVALFVGIEAKRPDGGRVSEDQRRFLTALEQSGAVQGVVRSVAELETVLAPWRGRQP